MSSFKKLAYSFACLALALATFGVHPARAASVCYADTDVVG